MPQEIDLGVAQNRTMIRSTFKPKTYRHITTCNTGDLIPMFKTIEVMPHETWKIKTNVLVRQQTPLHPTMDQAYADYWWFYVPHMQVWTNWNAFMGEVKDAAWVASTEYHVPKISIDSEGVVAGTILDYMGIPTGTGAFQMGALALRAYLHICNEWFRDQNIEAPITFPTDDSTITYDSDYAIYGGIPYQVNRKADYFSTALPEPQRGDTVTIGISGTAPIIVNETATSGAAWVKLSGGALTSVNATDGNITSVTGASFSSGSPLQAIGYNPKDTIIADLSEATAVELNDIRDAARTKQIFETDARAGARAPEMLWARWGVEVDDIELQRPRVLDCETIPLDIYQVQQTSATEESSPQGNLAGFGYTQRQGDWATHSFKYAGTLMCLLAIRAEHTYQYGVPREDMKFDRFDFWHPEFAGEGDQGAYDFEIYATSENLASRTIFGYTERGAEYKNFMSMVSSEMRSQHAASLDSWHYADKYTGQPTLSAEWMKENPTYVDRTIAVSSSVSKQWYVHFSAEFEVTRAMPVKSIPGIDIL